MRRDPARIQQSALGFWEKARENEARGRMLLAAHLYIRGLGRFLSCSRLLRASDAVPVYHALAAMGREAALLIARADGAHRAIECARMALAASHLADPTAGDPQRVGAVLHGAAKPMFTLVLGAHKGAALTLADRIAGAAQARVLLAELMVRYRDLPRTGDRWPIGSGGQVGYGKEQRRFLRAILPGCAGLSHDEEMHWLAEEAVAIYTELCTSDHGYESARKDAMHVYTQITEILRR